MVKLSVMAHASASVNGTNEDMYHLLFLEPNLELLLVEGFHGHSVLSSVGIFAVPDVFVIRELRRFCRPVFYAKHRCVLD